MAYKKDPPKRDNIPHSLEAEQAVLGSVMIDSHAYNQIADIVTGKDFYLPMNAAIFDAIEMISGMGSTPDLVTVSNYLTNVGSLDSSGGIGYIAGLVTLVPTSINAEHYARIIRRHSVMRSLLDLSGRMENDAYSSEDEQVIIDGYIDALKELRNVNDRSTYEHWSKIAQEYWDSIDDADVKHGVLTGYTELDLLTHGLPRGEITILGARSSQGKTALALNIALRVASYGGKSMVQSLEMGDIKIVQRLLSMQSGVPHENIVTGRLTELERQKIEETIESAAHKSILIDDGERLTTNDIEQRIKRHNPDLLVVDHLGFIKSMGDAKENRVQALDNTTMALKAIAVKMDIAVLLLSQLSREVEKRSDHRPVLSDLRESGGIEQNAGLVLLGYRDLMYDAESEQPNVFELEVAKNRDGKRGTIRLWVKDELMKFESMVRETTEASPMFEQPEQTEMGY